MPLGRKTPLRRSKGLAAPQQSDRKAPSHPRRFKTPRCIGLSGKRACKKPQEDLQRCRKHRNAYLDSLWSKRLGETCTVGDLHDREGFRCAGPIQAGHGFDRAERPSRWDLRNRFWICAAANKWGDVHRRRWYDYVRERMGLAVWDTLALRNDAAGRAKEKFYLDYFAIEADLLDDILTRRTAAMLTGQIVWSGRLSPENSAS